MMKSDFDRSVYNLLGLSFDAVDMKWTIDLVLSAIEEDRKLFLSTPNLNFLIAAQKNETFRNSVIHSDLSIADGMPIVLMCKLLKIPITERVAGSSLIEKLRSDERCLESPKKVFFFGGEDGVAEKAHAIINDEKKGLKSVGYLNPGFGSVEDMSSQAIIDEINDADPDLLIVSLGAAKGQLWIEANREALNASVISHLGAVVNFIAGTVKRAPHWVQKCHLEWIWRIKEEPKLFKRYWYDGLGFLSLLIRKILPYSKIVRRETPYSTPTINADYKSNTLILKGNITSELIPELHDTLKKFTNKQTDFTVEMSSVSYIDQSFLGLMLVLHKVMSAKELKISYVGISPHVSEIIKLNNLDFLIKNP